MLIFYINCPLQKGEVLVFYPVYMSLDKIRASVSTTADIPEFNLLGKIILYNDYILINKINKGVFIIDNSNKTSPQIKKFIGIPGNIDIAVSGNVLYADSYVDLLAFDISDINNIILQKRINNIFPRNDMQPFLGKNINLNDPIIIEKVDSEKGIVVDWEEKKEIRTIEIEYRTQQPFYYGMVLADGGVETPAASIAGSMARFTLYNNYLYTVDNNSLYVFNISNPMDPTYDKKLNVNMTVETIFCYEKKLFIGDQDGVSIYDVSEDPSRPNYVSVIYHITAKDPVVVKDRYLYYTVRGRESWENELNIFDISNIKSPVSIATYAMTEPYGLGITEISGNDYLFVCDGKEGIKIYDAKYPPNLYRKTTILKGEQTYDIILYNNTAYIVTKSSFYQYDYTDINNLTLLSKLGIK